MAFLLTDIFGIPVSIILTVIAVILCVVYTYTTWKYGYLESLGVPVVKPYFCLGSTPNPCKYVIHDRDMEWFRKHGKIWGAYEGREPFLFIADREIIKQVMVKDFDYFHSKRIFELKPPINEFLDMMQGEKWKVVRNKLSPVFTSGKLKNMAASIIICAENLVTAIKEEIKIKPVINVKRWFNSLTMDVIASCVFGTKIKSISDPENPFVKNGVKLLSLTTDDSSLAILPFIFPFICKWFDIFNAEAVHFFHYHSKMILEARRKEERSYGDFIDTLLKIASELDSAESKRLGITENTIHAQAIMFFLAGFETTSNTLTTLIYNLATNPDVQEKLIEEVDKALTENNEEITYEMVQSLPYMDACLSETLRMFPPVIRTERMSNKDWQHDDLKVKKGTVVQIPVWVLHHDPENFPNPETFNPDRFLKENQDSVPSFGYLPFGGGPRMCLGMRFAMEEAKLTLMHLLREFRFKKCKLTKMEFVKGQMFMLKYCDIMVEIVPRQTGKENKIRNDE